MDSRSTQDRRGFLTSAIYGLWGIISAALAIPAGAYLLSPRKTKSGADWVEAGALNQLKVNEPEELVFRRNRADGWKITSQRTSAWVVRIGERELFALAPQCTHLGCAYHWDEQKQHFLCPCHTSAFGVDGKVLSGPAPRPLDRLEVRLEGNKILLGRVVESKSA